MFPSNGTPAPAIEQSSLHNGIEIFEAIQSELSAAQHSIKVAAAWFTDNELFQKIMFKRNQNCKVEIVLDDNKENYWLPFMDLVKNGATVKLSKGVGSGGRMNEKFCIIDDSILISGSYNWSKNARTDNHENVIISRSPSLVNEFNEKFQELLNSSVSYDSVNIQEQPVTKEEALKEINEHDLFTKEFEKVLDEMIYASVVEYNRDSLVSKGFERSLKCSGDSNIIYNELDTVYTEMLNSISASEQKKEVIKAKVTTHLEESISHLKDKCSRGKEHILIEEENLLKSLNHQIASIKEKSNLIKEEITKLEKSDIVVNSNRIKDLTEEKKAIESETTKMPFRWYVDIPTYLGLAGLFAYILLFYSSATYILMFSQRNAKIAQRLGQPVEELGIYFSKAIPNAWNSGFAELLPILFVPFVLVCGVIYLKKLKTHKYLPKWLIKLVCLVLIDGFTAVAVTSSIHENNYLAGIETDHFKLANIFSEMNFYLVFIFGMLSLLIFDLIISYVLTSLESRNDVHIKAKKQLRIIQINDEIAILTKQNIEHEALIINKKATIAHNLDLISSIEKEIQLQPSITSRKNILLENETNSQIINLQNIVKIAYNKIENELFSFSTHFIKDRINIFLQGWNNFIYSYYSKVISEQKIQQAKEIGNNWFTAHFSKNNTLIKTANNESYN